MKFTVISSAPVFQENGNIKSYSPFVKEMNVWFENFVDISILAPSYYPEKILLNCFIRNDIRLLKVFFLDFRNFSKSFVSILKLPGIIFKIIKVIRITDHIHIRCPGNMGLLGLLVSIFFPGKAKTIKYAGNWDKNSVQPLSYRFQKWLLNNPVLIRNKKVLIYGRWPKQPKHVISFFTASYSKTKIIHANKTLDEKIKFIFCGSLVPGKNPVLAIEIIHNLILKGYSIQFDIYGDGVNRQDLQEYIQINNLKDQVFLHGNETQSVLIEAYKGAHFCLLPSKSEGWPKAIAEGMFFGCVPIATNISCLPWMLEEGKRGILINFDVEEAAGKIEELIKKPSKYLSISKKARDWSQYYTLEKFEKAISELL